LKPAKPQSANDFDLMPLTKPTEAAQVAARARMRAIGSILVVTLSLVAGLGLVAFAQDKAKDPQGAYDRRSSPGSGQKFLEKFVGDWAVEKIFHPRTGDPVSTKGECHQTMINDGRFLKSEFIFYDGAANATGLGLVGFEADSGLFTSVWTDSRSTKMSIRQSKEPFDGSEIILASVPMANGVRETRPSRSTTRLADGGRKIIHQQSAINPDKTERLMMELILIRKENQ
jgi:hypothetical protein